MKRFCLKLRPYQPVGTTLREISLHGVTRCYALLHGGTCGPGGTVPAPKIPEEEKKGEEKKEGKGESEGDSRLAPLDVTKRILDDLNERTGNNYQARGKVVRRLIATRLNAGFAEADFIEVNRKMARQWMGDPHMEHCLTYETLYGPKFEKYAGQKEHGPQRPLAFTEGEKRAQRHMDRADNSQRRNRGGFTDGTDVDF